MRSHTYIGAVSPAELITGSVRVCVPGCSFRAKDMLLPACCRAEARSAACLLPPPLRRGIPCCLRHCCPQTAWAWVRESEGRRRAAKWHWQIEDRAGSYLLWILREDVQRSFTWKTLFMGSFADLCVVGLRTDVKRTLCICVCVSACVLYECLFLMRSERASRVCIVVLEEVEEDEPCSSSPAPLPKSFLDRRSHRVSRRAAAQDDKVRGTPLLRDFLIIYLLTIRGCICCFNVNNGFTWHCQHACLIWRVNLYSGACLEQNDTMDWQHLSSSNKKNMCGRGIWEGSRFVSLISKA